MENEFFQLASVSWPLNFGRKSGEHGSSQMEIAMRIYLNRRANLLT